MPSSWPGEMRVWYNDSLNRECAGEIRLLLARLTEESAETEPGSEGGADIESADDDNVADNGSDDGEMIAARMTPARRTSCDQTSIATNQLANEFVDEITESD